MDGEEIGKSTENPGNFRGVSTECPRSPGSRRTRVGLTHISPCLFDKRTYFALLGLQMQQESSVARRSRPRQEPVSCQSCRAKKLRCNRQQPCSNCLARGVTCLSQSRLAGRNEQSHPSGDNDSAAILSRLKRLEDLILGLNGTQIPSPQSDAPRSQSVTPSVRSRIDESSKTDAEFLEDVGTRTDFLVGSLSLINTIVCLWVIARFLDFRIGFCGA